LAFSNNDQGISPTSRGRAFQGSAIAPALRAKPFQSLMQARCAVSRECDTDETDETLIFVKFLLFSDL